MAVLDSKEVDDVLIVNFKDAKILDENVIQQVGKELVEVSAHAAEGKLLVNFSGVTFMSSAMIGNLVKLHKHCKGYEIAVKYSNVSESIAEVFKIMGLNKVFDIHKDEEKAMKAFGKKGWFG